MSPATPEDWTVLKLNRRKVEREVLEQVEALPCILPTDLVDFTPSDEDAFSKMVADVVNDGENEVSFGHS